MGSRLRVAAGLLASAVFSISSPATSQTGADFGRAVDRTIDRVIVPGYATLAKSADVMVVSMRTLCEDPSERSLEAARVDFARVVTDFSRVELFRFGPAREDNRFERLFFWPDRRGRGRRQVEALIAREDRATLEVAALRRKSVAVQGLLALDYVVAGNGSRGLANGSAAHRCRQGGAIAAAIARTASEIHRCWTNPKGFGSAMRRAGPDNPVYRTPAEVVQDLLGAAGEQLQIVQGLKLHRTLRDGPDTARPKSAPFWRSGLAVATLVANLDGVLELLNRGEIGRLLPASEAGLAERAVSELSRARDRLARVSGADLPEVLADAARHRELVDTAMRIGAVASLLGEDLAHALGLAPGSHHTPANPRHHPPFDADGMIQHCNS